MTLQSISGSESCSQSLLETIGLEISNVDKNISNYSKSIFQGDGSSFAKGLALYVLSSCIVHAQAADEEGPYSIAGSVATVVVGVLATGFSILSFLGSRQSQIKSVRSDVIAERDNDIQELAVLHVDLLKMINMERENFYFIDKCSA
ncbi:MAG: hypothetical protein ACI8RA_000843 [Chlamydiales bacterium]|jgi:hypothetical protein